MKRGVIINLTVVFILLTVIASPWLVIGVVSLIGSANGCSMNMAGGEGELCTSLTGIAFLSGMASIVIMPIGAGILAIYLVGIVIFFIASLVRNLPAGRPVSPVAKGMLASSLAVGLVGGSIGGGVWAIDWYKSSYVSACEGLPAEVGGSGRQNGPLAMAVRLAAAAGSLDEHAILAVGLDGQVLGQLSRKIRSQDPAWSPDGSQVAFVAQDWETKRWGLYLAGREGDGGSTVGEPVLEDDFRLLSPAWAPDGQALFFTRGSSGEGYAAADIFRVEKDGSNLTGLPGSPQFDGDARLSPDGTQIVFTSQRDGFRDIFVMDRDGSNVRPLTRGNGENIDPAWSPDGKWIVFATNRDTQYTGRYDYNLYIMAPDGSNQCQLTAAEGVETGPVWSPDGQWIAYVSVVERMAYLVRPDGSETRAVPASPEIGDLLSLDWAAAP